MSPTQTCVVGLRLLAIWFLVESVLAFEQGVAASPYNREYFGYLMYSSAMLVVTGVVYQYSLPIAKSLLRGAPDVPLQSASQDEWLALGCSLMGLWFSVKALSSISANLYVLSVSTTLVKEDKTMATLGYYTVQLFLGIILVLGRNGIRRIIVKARGR
ncbi:MAG: hypothetical protein ABSD75_24610 [Terriglobales bacterium]|jgi:hypothetical protein